MRCFVGASGNIAAGMPASQVCPKMMKTSNIVPLVIIQSLLLLALPFISGSASPFFVPHKKIAPLYTNGVALARRPAMPFTRQSLHFVFCVFAGIAGATLCHCTALNSSFAAIRRTTLYTVSAFLLLPMQFW